MGAGIFPSKFLSCLGFDLFMLCPQFLPGGKGMFPLCHCVLGICKKELTVKRLPESQKRFAGTLLSSAGPVQDYGNFEVRLHALCITRWS